MEQLQEYLKASGTTQSAMAEALGVSPGHMSEVIRCKKRPSLDLAFAIERATAGAVPAALWAEKEK